jgi:hypothetical protein
VSPSHYKFTHGDISVLRTFWKYCHLHDLYDFLTLFSYLVAYPLIFSSTSLLKDLSSFSLPLEPPGRIEPWPTATYYALYRFHPRSTIHWTLSETQVYFPLIFEDRVCSGTLTVKSVLLVPSSLHYNLDFCFTSIRCLFADFTQCPYLVLWQRWFCAQRSMPGPTLLYFVAGAAWACELEMYSWLFNFGNLGGWTRSVDGSILIYGKAQEKASWTKLNQPLGI